MANVREEICRLIRLNQEGRWVPPGDPLERLTGIGQELIPGLMECLVDGHPEVRRLAIELLAELCPLSAAVVSALTERLTDEDWLVQVAVMTRIGGFGPLAVGAIPNLEPWLDSPNEYLRLLAATTILTLDPNRHELLPSVWVSLGSEHPVVSDLAREFLEL